MGNRANEEQDKRKGTVINGCAASCVGSVRTAVRRQFVCRVISQYISTEVCLYDVSCWNPSLYRGNRSSPRTPSAAASTQQRYGSLTAASASSAGRPFSSTTPTRLSSPLVRSNRAAYRRTVHKSLYVTVVFSPSPKRAPHFSWRGVGDAGSARRMGLLAGGSCRRRGDKSRATAGRRDRGPDRGMWNPGALDGFHQPCRLNTAPASRVGLPTS